MGSRALLGLAFALVAAATACGPTYYDSYRADHPGWNATFPRLGASLEESVAALQAPKLRGAVHGIRVYDVTGEAPVEVSLRDIEAARFESAAHADYVVIARMACARSDSGAHYVANGDAWYWLPKNALAAYRHLRFAGDGCAPATDSHGADLLPPRLRGWLEGGPGA
jgi:hypothetical protein